MQIIRFIVGDGQPYTPANGANQYTNPQIGGNPILFYINGKGFMFEGVDYTMSYTNTIQFIGTTLFNTGEQVTIIILD